MKGRKELIALAIMLIMCLVFAACAQNVEDKLTDKATDPSLLTSAKTDSGFVDGDKDGKKSDNKSSTSQQVTTEKSKPVSAKEAEKKLKLFYGSLYKVEKKDDEHYTIKDNNGKEYATVKAYLKGGVFTETITESGEKNVIRFQDIKE